MKNLLVLTIALLSAETVLAAGGEGIPTQTIIFQAINVSLFVGLLTFLLRGKIKDHFISREASFHEAKNRAEELLKKAEEQRREIEVKLRDLDATQKETIERAKKEAAEMKKNILAEADTLSEQIRKEANKSAEMEIRRVRESLRQQLMVEAVEQSRNAIAGNLSSDDQSRLQAEFIKKVGNKPQAVQA